MQCSNLFDEVRTFRSGKLKRVCTTVTRIDGQQFVETCRQDGYSMSRTGRVPGYVVDNKADISVAFIMDGLILGSQDVAAELKILEDFNVTHILNVAFRVPNFYESKFIYKNVEILDDPSTDIRIFFDGCFDFIADGRQEGCVLVHCNAGVSRAPTIIIAYLMAKHQMTLNKALSLVKSVRCCVRPNDGFLKVLQQYEKEILYSKELAS